MSEDGETIQFVDTRLAARRDQIAAAWDRWRQDDIVAAEERSGYRTAFNAKLAAVDVLKSLRAAIVATPATTMHGLRLKAEAALGSCGSTSAEWLKALDEGCGSSEQIAATICVDLLAMVRSAA